VLSLAAEKSVIPNNSFKELKKETCQKKIKISDLNNKKKRTAGSQDKRAYHSSGQKGEGNFCLILAFSFEHR